MKQAQSGQSLIEVLIGLLITGIVVGALVIATIVGLRNAQFSQQQAQATQRAQEGMELVRTIRDRDGTVNFSYGTDATGTFSEIWNHKMSQICPTNKCFFQLNPNVPSLTGGTEASLENLGSGLTRQVIFEDSGLDPSKEKQITVNVYWTDSGGQHQSNLQTILGKK